MNKDIVYRGFVEGLMSLGVSKEAAVAIWKESEDQLFKQLPGISPQEQGAMMPPPPPAPAPAPAQQPPQPLPENIFDELTAQMSEEERVLLFKSLQRQMSGGQPR
jgi:hypothetical protein